MDNTISQLEKSKFPADLQNISIITFTDGLDKDSSAKNSIYQSPSEYLEAIQKRILSTTINGKPTNAYSIGLKGQDVQDEKLFESNLKGLASPDDPESEETHAITVTNIDEVNEKFINLAASLYKKNIKQSLKLAIPQPYNNTKIRFTFDTDLKGNVESSKCYIEGVFLNGALTQIHYEGLTSSSGETIKCESAGSINISFTFADIKLDEEKELDSSRIKQ